jgi:acetyl esterase/lipase
VRRPLQRLEEKLEPTRKVPFKTVDGETLHLHIFEPEGHRVSDRRPAFVVFHGGGWTLGTTRSFYPFAGHFAKKGMVGISVDYRLVESKRGRVADPINGTTVFDCVKDGRSAVR